MVAVREVAAVTEKTAAVTAGTDGAEGSRPRGLGRRHYRKGRGERNLARAATPGREKGRGKGREGERGKKGGKEGGEKGGKKAG